MCNFIYLVSKSALNNWFLALLLDILDSFVIKND